MSLKELAQESQFDRFLTALSAVMEKTLRIIYGERLTVHVAEIGIAPAWSLISKRECYINKSNQDAMAPYDETTANIMGLLYHEVSHLMWTPSGNSTDSGKPAFLNRLYTELNILSLDYDLALRLWNILEDKRIEGNFVRRYPPARSFFAIPVLNYILNDKSEMDSTYIVLSGRQWIDSNLYDETRKAAEHLRGPAWTEALDRLVMEYMQMSTLDVFSDVQRVARLINQLRMLCVDAGKHPISMHSCVANNSSSTGKIVARSDGKNADTHSDKGLSNEDLEDLAEMGKSSDDPAQGNGEGEDTSPDSSSAASEDSSDGGSTGTTSTNKASAAALSRARTALSKASSEVKDEAHKASATANRLAECGDSEQPSSVCAIWRTEVRDVTADMLTVSRRISTQLSDIRNAAAPEWLKSEPVGKLNVYRAFDEESEDMNIFDRYDEGQDDDMRAHISFGIDLSSSMDHGPSSEPPFVGAAKALWILENAFKAVDHDFDAYGYDDAFQRLDERHNRSSYYVRRPRGSTRPDGMIVDMITRSAASSSLDKLIVILTDGSWSVTTPEEEKRYVKMFDTFREVGGYSMLFMYKSNEHYRMQALFDRKIVDEKHPYGVDEWHYIDSVQDIVPATGNFVKQLMAKHLAR